MIAGYFHEVVDWMGLALDGIGVLIVVGGAFIAIVRALRSGQDANARYRMFRVELGRAIVLGLEFLIAGDIIRTVVVNPNIVNVAVLGLIVLIRTFLTMTLQLEVEGHWPWHRTAGDEHPK